MAEGCCIAGLFTLRCCLQRREKREKSRKPCLAAIQTSRVIGTRWTTNESCLTSLHQLPGNNLANLKFKLTSIFRIFSFLESLVFIQKLTITKLKFEDYITEICEAILGYINNFGYKETFPVTTDEQDNK
jgi:hypothetical protein